MASPGNPNRSSSRYASPAESGDSCFLEAGPSKTFTSSTLRLSTSRFGTPGSGKRFRKLSVEAPPDIPLNDDCNELIEEKERSIAEQEKSLNKSSNKAEEEQDVSIVKTMTMEQMQEHVSRCLQLSTENKINTKNAFALKLIDCMTIITKNDDESNFAVMACQLDAGAKIYSSRVDAVHQQVMKLVDTCMFAEKKKKETNNEGDDEGSDNEDGSGGGREKEKKKRPRKKVIATHDQISRQPKENDPKDMFVRLDALPGDILNKARYSPEDLSLTLDKHTPFWMDMQSYKPTRPDGENEILDIEIKTRQLRPKLEFEVDLVSIPKIESFLGHSKSPLAIKDEEDFIDEVGGGSFINNDSEDEADIDMVTLAKSRMNREGSNIPSTNEVIKTLFHQPGESDYHYLKMDNSNFWAGPSYWKRPHGHNLAENKKKVMRKKREPVEVQYSESEGVKQINEIGIGPSNKRASTLSKRTMAKWSKKKVTYPQDINFEPEAFHMLFHINIVAAVALQNAEEEQNKNKGDEDTQSKEGDNNYQSPDMFADEDNGSQDMFDQRDETSGSGGSFSGFRGFSSPGSSNLEDQLGFRGFPSPSGSSPFDPEHGFRGFGSEDSETQGSECLNPSTSDSNRRGISSDSCDVYEGENLVPMVKTVKVDPIRFVAKPNRVDMQHLKCVMLSIIRRAIEDRENQLKDEGLSSSRGSVTFREVLTQLFSSDKLHHRTRQDLSVQMAFLCLLMLTNENGFNLKKDESDDVLIMYDLRECPSVVK